MRAWIRDHPLAFAVIGVALAIAGTTLLDAVGFGLNVLPLIPLFFICWYLQGFSRAEVYLAQIVGSAMLFAGSPWGIYLGAVGLIVNFSFLVSGSWLLIVGTVDRSNSTP